MGFVESLQLDGVLGQVGNFLGTFLLGLFTLIIVSAFIWWMYVSYKNKTLYNIPITFTRILENGTEKSLYNLKGGECFYRGVKDFKIKIPRRRKPHLLGYIPDYSKADGDGRLHFIAEGDKMAWQQYEKKWILEEEVEYTDEKGEVKTYKVKLINKPIRSETKLVAVNSIKNWKDTVDKQKLTAWSIAIGAFIIMTIAHLVSLFIQTRLKCG